MENKFIKTSRHGGLDDRDHIFITPAILTTIDEHRMVDVKKVDIKFEKQEHRRLGLVAKVVKERVKPINDESGNELRAMGSESDGFDFCDEAIDKVAKANSVRIENTQILPKVSASSCPFHTKSDRSKNELLYMSNHHGGHISQKRHRKKHTSNTSSNSRKRGPKLPTDMDIKQLERELDKYPKFPSALPTHMPSKEFVMTWLLHGSEPDNHFPEITTPKSKKQLKMKPINLSANRHSFASE